MHHRWLNILVLSSGVLIHAETINLHGTVSSGGKPISGANVTLMKAGAKVTTGADGAYSFTQLNTALSSRAPGAGMISFSGGVLEFKLAESSPVAIEVFDIKSNRLKAENLGTQGAGQYRFDITGKYPANQLLIVRASVGRIASTFRYLPMGVGNGAQAGLVKSAESRAFAKTAAAIDSLEVTASGYSARKVMVESYDAKLDVSLDKVDNSGDIWGGLKNPPVKSAGCGKATTIKTGAGTLMSGGVQRPYVVDVSANYDMNHPHRFFFNSHGQGSNTSNYLKDNYYDMKPNAAAANEPGVFFGGQGYGGSSSTSGSAWSEKDHAFFDDVVTFFKNNMCIDETRIFTIGMSMGGMQTYSLSTTHAKKIRAGVGIAAANFNIWLPATRGTEPEAWMQTTGMSDGTCPWISNEAQKRGSKFIALEKAANNGCTIPAEIPTWKSGAHVCYDFQGCKPGYPVKACTFNGGHSHQARDPGSTVNWIGVESYKFFTQF
ncbi:MAG: hypothetical protein ABIW76_05235 [Fibrobacteria bacterium]